jgi:hypothetical protein
MPTERGDSRSPSRDLPALGHGTALAGLLLGTDGPADAASSVASSWRAGGPAPEDDARRESLGRIGRFEVIEPLGRGGWGMVLLAFDPNLRQRVALKIPWPEVLASSGSRRRFLDEARALARMDHPNVVSVFEADAVGDLCYLAMRYCEAGSLADRLRARRDRASRAAPPAWAAEFVAATADGVQHAHDRGILHRDLKPANILLRRPQGEPAASADDDEPGRWPRLLPLVADFSHAGRLDPAELRRTREGDRVGTLPYMAPEQVLGALSALGPGADVYGLGAILYELLTGRRVVAGGGEDVLVPQILHAEPVPPSRARPGVPRALEAIALRCLAKDPAGRFASPKALASALRGYLDRAGRPWPRRHPLASAALALSACALPMGLVAADRLHRQDVSVWLRQLEAADVAALPELVGRHDPRDPAARARLDAMLRGRDPGDRLAARAVLAPIRPDCAEAAFEALLDAGDAEIRPLALALDGRVGGLAARLARFAASEPPGPEVEARDAHDRRRAAAAAALVHLGRPEAALDLLRFRPDPQARSHLIHRLGPSGVPAGALLDLLADEHDPARRRALIQALGEVPEGGWSAGERARALDALLDRYRGDPDPGVHGSARWLLRRWARGPSGAEVARRLDAIDRGLAGRPAAPGFGWRVSPRGLTLATLDDPALGRAIEAADAEVTFAQYAGLLPGPYRHDRNFGPADDCPVNMVTLRDAQAFCNALSAAEGLPPEQRCYVAGPAGYLVPADDYLDRPGYRLPTEAEFEALCRAGTATLRYHGDSARLLGSYANHAQTQGPVARALPVGSLKPNDLGLFDTLGNAFDLAQPSPSESPRRRASLCGGAMVAAWPDVWYGSRLADRSDTEPLGPLGFRVVRTRVEPDPP